ncbi:MAG: hypothetical protein N3E48_00125 [Candidatus Bathyarchaeota archaeon]|nr:hypothetical protein [Candidatus Bathyarchaeota archaeon]
MSLKRILKNVKKELKIKSSLREKMLLNSRKITQKSKKTILLLHQNKLEKAEKILDEAKKLLNLTMDFLKNAPELQTSGALFAAAQEYAEASIFLYIEKIGLYPPPEEVGVSSSAYVLGLADVVGELKRKVSECLRIGNVKKAEHYFKHMEDIYKILSALNEHVFLVMPTLRRKCDVTRHLVESAGSELLLEKRRKSLEEYLKLVEKKRARVGDFKVG